jgi:transcriptional regulator with XRE-family HTH domain
VERLRIMRAERGMTLRELEEASGIGKDAISEIERGLRQPRIGTIMQLAEGLGIDPGVLLKEVAHAPAQRPERIEAGGAGPFTAVYQRDGEWWIGFVEELPGANAQERSLDEVRESLREAVADVLDANRELTRTEFEGRDVVREPIGA